VLRVQNLYKRFGDKLAVADLSFEIQAGEIVAVLGPNGAGKTTTFLMLSGLVRPDGGSIFVDGKDLGTRRGRRIALIPETPEVYGALTVWEHVVFAARSCRVGPGWEERASELLERFNLSDQRDTLGAALSKGMKQKTLIVATVIADAPVLLLDEPMIGLDPAGQRELRELLIDLASSGKAIAVSTHMLEAARAVGERALILKNGAKIFDGSLAQSVREGEDLEDAFLRVTT
jgi:ABC-2 type transport system ATP-binding protein